MRPARKGSVEVRDRGLRNGAAWLLPFYRLAGREVVRKRIRRWIVQTEGGPAFSSSIRRLLSQYHGLEVGAFSYWPWWLKPSVFHRGTRIGRYAWVSHDVRTFTRNHPLDLLSTHGFFYNPELGKVSSQPVSFGILEIGHGAWLGPGVIVLPPARRIGIGAVVQPGSVVCMDVPDYAVVSGFPARQVGWRVQKSEVEHLLASRWWERPPREFWTAGRKRGPIFPALVGA
ncbi:MAG: hypothetical protein KatS3mg132_004 [Limisphaera sp.]|nr:MAG: hypothetical protein KatS3mg132_004 [Limisphaera sp.]